MNEAELRALEARLNKMHEQIVADTGTLKGLVREAHETSKDLLRLIREAHKTTDEIGRIAVGTAHAMIEEATKQGLEHFGHTILSYIDDASEAVQRRFDALSEVLLGRVNGKDPGLAGTVQELVDLSGPFTKKQIAPFMEGRPTQGDTDD